MEGVDAFALILGLVLLFVLIFAAIGKYARHKGYVEVPPEQQSSSDKTAA